MIQKRFSPEITEMLAYSKREALRLQSGSITPIHLLLGLLGINNNRANELLFSFDINSEALRNTLEQTARQESNTPTVVSEEEIVMDSQVNRIMRLSVLESARSHSECINLEHILLALMKDGTTSASRILADNNVTYNQLDKFFNHPQEEPKDSFGFSESDGDEDAMPVGADETPSFTEEINKNPKKSATPALDSFGSDITKAAREGILDPVVGREQEILRVAQILARRKKNNPILIGAPGVGKSAIVEGLAMRIASRQVSRMLWNKRIVMLDMSSVVAGTKYRGQFEERMKTIIKELKQNSDVIVFIDEIHTLVGAGSAEGTMDAANMLKPALARGEFQCIGATTFSEYKKSIEKDGALERRFQKVTVNPTNAEETLTILHNLRPRYEEHHGVRYTDAALEACVRYTERYVTNRDFPDKAIDALDEAGARTHIIDLPVSPEIAQLEKEINNTIELKNAAVKAQNFELAAEHRDHQRELNATLEQKQSEWEEMHRDTDKVVDAEDVANVVSAMTGIPVQRINQLEGTRLRTMKDVLKHNVVGQDDAVDTLIRSIQRSRLGLKDPNKPTGVFLFVGPTGVGKTYLTKKLAEELFGTQDALIRIDMSEYMEKHTVSRMVGAPPGYVGYEEGGQLTERVRRKPYSIVLLDEIEKAHKDVFNMLLQVMDEGRLTDGNGATIDFRNTVIIMTSNAGTKQLKEFGQAVGFQTPDHSMNDKARQRDVISKSLQKQFAPEFLNRLDDIIYFDSLQKEHILRIVDIELLPLQQRVKEMGYSLQFTEEAKQALADKGFDVQYGARPLKRAIQTQIEDRLCQLLLEQEVAEGTTLEVTTENNEITIKTI